LSDDLERVRSRLNIVDVVGRRVSLKKAGKDFKGICPFHDDKSPSMHVSPRMGIFKCFVCGAGGDAFNFVMKFQRIDFVEALKILAEEVGVTLSQTNRGGGEEAQAKKAERQAIMRSAQDFFVAELKSTKPAMDYCERRGITPEVIEEWGLGFGPAIGEAMVSQIKKGGQSLAEARELFLIEERDTGGYYDRFRGRLMFPIRDEGGKIVAYGGRIIGDGNPKYINSGDTPLYSKRRILYGFDKAKGQIASDKKAVLVEGYLDVIACHRAGVKTAVASLGTSLSEEHAKLLARWAEDVVVLYDGDAAGEKAASRAQELLQAEGVRVKLALMPPGEDPDTLLRTAGPQAVVAAVNQALSPLDFAIRQVKKLLDPSEPEFWEQIVTILAGAPSQIEMERHLVELAGLYPGIRDRMAAVKALKNDILKVKRKTNPQNSQRTISYSKNISSKVTGLHSFEIVVFRGLFEENLTKKAWEIVIQEDIFINAKASEIAREISALPQEHHGQIAQNFLVNLSEPTQEFLSGISIQELVRLELPQLEEAEKKLLRMKEKGEITEQRLSGVKTDDELRKLQERLQKFKNDQKIE